MTERIRDRARIGDVDIAYQVSGQGDPVVLVHAAVLADFFAPLAERLDGFQVISYDRVGYGRSSRPSGPVEIADQAEHCRALLEHLGHDSAHVVGHSSGGLIALQLALQSPTTVDSLALLEPSLVVPGSELLAQQVIGPMFQRYLAGDKAGAIDIFLRGVCGPDYREYVDRMLPPGAMDQAVADTDTFLQTEAPSVGRWTFGRDEAARLPQPVLSVVGDQSALVSQQAHELLLGWFPSAEAYVLPKATHLLHVQDPESVSDALTAFFGRHARS
jgi:pimeloyl-ACP methyl ester carboxylesterase